jgi:hypothetical protein
VLESFFIFPDQLIKVSSYTSLKLVPINSCSRRVHASNRILPEVIRHLKEKEKHEHPSVAKWFSSLAGFCLFN